jgi:tetratricopeptide (TPR) repeat protein/predicted Ser/Thr protein kinase
MSDPTTPFPAVKGLRPIRQLGAGGMGVVYLAEDETLGRQVAVKVVSERFVSTPAARARFEREARSMATVEHPNVVRVYSYGKERDRPYFVMEYVEGASLSDRLRRGPLSVAEAIGVCRQVVSALEAAWEKGLVHRDVKPSNILLDLQGNVRVADFGLAKPAQGTADASLTETGSLLGTAHYVSPEQARGDAVDFRSDIYSLGIVLFEMLAGSRPFEGATPFEIVAKHLTEPTPPLRQRCAGLSEAVERLVAAMTDKRPEARPDSYGALRRQLDGVIADEPVDMASATSATSTMPRGALRPAERPHPLLATAALAAAAAVLLWQPWREDVAATRAKPSGLVIAVAPFYGPDEESLREGRVMAALIEKAIAEKVSGEGVRLVRTDETKQAVRDHDAARAMGERLGATAVVWGESYVLRGEAQVQPYLTMVPQRLESARRSLGAAWIDHDTRSIERAGAATTVGAQAGNQIELRATGAAGVGDLVLMLTGVHHLYSERSFARALAVFERTPRSAETLRYRAECLLGLERSDEALRAAREAVSLDPSQAANHALLGDQLLLLGRLREAADAYAAAASRGAYVSQQGALDHGRLIVRETFRAWLRPGAPRQDTGYVVGLDPGTGHVLERHRLPNRLLSFASRDGRLEISHRETDADPPVDGTVALEALRARGSAQYFGLSLCRASADSGVAIAANFIDPDDARFVPQGQRPEIPRSFPELESALQALQARDETRPWPLFLLGAAHRSQGRRDLAEAAWSRLLTGEYPATPFFEWNWMALRFEKLGEPAWADRAAQRAARAWPGSSVSKMTPLIERLIGWPAVRYAAERVAQGREIERGHAWLQRVRDLAPVPEGDEFAAAAWAAYYRGRGDAAAASAESLLARSLRDNPISFSQRQARLDYALNTLSAALLALWLLLAWFASNAWRRRRASGRTGGLTARERTAALAALGVVCAAGIAVNRETSEVAGLSGLPIALGNRFVSPASVALLDRKLDAVSTARSRFVAGVAHHAAGDRERAGELYSDLADSRAGRNREALSKGLGPVEWPSEAELLAVYSAVPLSRQWRDLWRPGRMLAEFSEPSSQQLSAWITGAFVASWALGLLVLAHAYLRPEPESGDARPDLLPGAFLPGALDIGGSAPLRGYVALLLFCLAGVAVSMLCATSSNLPMPGLVTFASQIPTRSFPAPSWPWWSMFWTWVYAPYYWGAAGLAFVTSLWLHARTLRAVLRAAATAAAARQE